MLRTLTATLAVPALIWCSAASITLATNPPVETAAAPVTSPH